jgi:predicted metal-dependent hydrolase
VTHAFRPSILPERMSEYLFAALVYRESADIISDFWAVARSPSSRRFQQSAETVESSRRLLDVAMRRLGELEHSRLDGVAGLMDSL